MDPQLLVVVALVLLALAFDFVNGFHDAANSIATVVSTRVLSPGQAVIITFHFDVAVAAKKKWPAIQVYWLHGYEKDKKTGQYPELAPLIEKAKAPGLDGLNLEHDFPLDAAAIKRVHDAGLKCYVWTLDDPVKARQLAAAGIDGITTNRPAALRRELAAAR